jgi:hypothetical protein
MKYTICAITLACAFAAQDSTPPVISLNLAAGHTTVSAAYSQAGNKAPAHGNYKANSFARRCNVVTSPTSANLKAAQTNCPSPDATAYDHHQGDLTSQVTVVAKQYVTSAKNSNPVKTDRTAAVKNNKLGAAEYANRGEFVLTYNVNDASGNAAEELVFAMIMVDKNAPVIVPPAPETIEACQEATGKRCIAQRFTATATDAYDNKQGKDAYRTFTFAVGTANPVAYKGNTIKVELKQTGDQTVFFVATDFADIFGKNNQDNVSKQQVTFTVKDTTKPRILLKQYGVRAQQNACSNARVSGVSSVEECRVYTLKNYVPGVARFNKYCAGCKSGKCYFGGNNKCNSVFVGKTSVVETVECAAAGTAVPAMLTKNALKNGNGANCVDDRRSASLTNNQNNINTLSATATGKAFKPNCAGSKASCHFAYTYSCTDGKLAADNVVRTVKVVDRKDPTLKIGVKSHLRQIHGAGSAASYNSRKGHSHAHNVQATNPWSALSTIQHSAGFTADEKYIQDLTTRRSATSANGAYECTDTCDAESALTTTVTWNKCKSTQADCCANKKDFDSNFSTFKALVVGDWCITYTCTDTSNNSVTKYRNLRNEDHAKPVITILGGDQMVFEASNSANYVDAGATCMDQVDGNISQDVEVSGDVVNLARVGTYKIYYNCKDTANNKADLATRTVVVQDTTCPTCNFKDAAAHQSLVLEASFPYTDNFANDVKCSDELTANIKPVPTTYLGEKNQQGKWQITTTKYTKTITDTTGVYYTVYTATDDTKNSNIISGKKNGVILGGNGCKFQTLDSQGKPTPLAYTSSAYTRTIEVKDTLKPVIKLSLKNAQGADEIIKAGSADASSASNFAYQKQSSNFPSPDAPVPVAQHTADSHLWKLMAEETTSSVNGWVLGAIASAVSGLALLGYSLRKQAQPVATSVPV